LAGSTAKREVRANKSDPFRSYFSKLNQLGTAATIGITHRQSDGAGTVSLGSPSPLTLLGERCKIYASLSKAKLSGLVVATTVAGFAMGPLPMTLAVLGSPSFWATIGGTALCAASANSFNQWMEAPFDARMARTRLRPLPTQRISSRHAFAWASGSAIAGLGTLWIGAGPLATALAALTIGLYTLVYTPLKRCSVVNTWVGAVVGAIPPMIGYAGAMALAGTGLLFPEAYLLGAVLYCWQFPHFNALSHNLRHDYQRAGYCMAAIQQPSLNRWAALTHSLALVPVTLAFPFMCGMTSSWFALDGTLVNLVLCGLALRFAWDPNRKTAKRLFLYSLLYLPLLLILMIVHKENKKRDEDLDAV
jgi:protoheme IX farnesyltransferase